MDYDSQKIRRTTLSTTAAELYALMECFGTCQFIRGLCMDISGEASPIHLRTDALNLVSTASETHLPEQTETIHMVQMLRKENVLEKWKTWDMFAPSTVCQIALPNKG